MAHQSVVLYAVKEMGMGEDGEREKMRERRVRKERMSVRFDHQAYWSIHFL